MEKVSMYVWIYWNQKKYEIWTSKESLETSGIGNGIWIGSSEDPKCPWYAMTNEWMQWPIFGFDKHYSTNPNLALATIKTRRGNYEIKIKPK